MSDKTLRINNYLTEVKDEILAEIKSHKRLLLSSNPATGKTTLFAKIILENKHERHFNRIIFCAPFVIIQEQFKEKLKEFKLTIDLELNQFSKRKRLVDKDSVITSTFKSFYRISSQLKPNDLVVIDEAHSILNMFEKKLKGKISYEFYQRFYQTLYEVKANVVFMTGTPISSFKFLFKNIFELKVLNNSLSAKILIQKSSLNKQIIIEKFVNECIEKYGDKSLNIIYTKSIKNCLFFYELIKEMGYEPLVLTSKEKENEQYKNLVEKSIISSHVQFLITTNVISTGANILNTNVGKALMLNEHNPVEIKQFSKRFRKKLDIEIDIVNRFNSKIKDLKRTRENILLGREKNRKYIVNHFSTWQILHRANFDDSLDFNMFSNLGAKINPSVYFNNILDRNLLQEIYYQKEINRTYNSRQELSEKLDEFDDLIPVQVQGFQNNTTNNKVSIKDYSLEINNCFKDIINEPVKYLHYFLNYIELNYRYSEYLETIKSILINFKRDSSKEKKVNIKLPTVLFEKEVLFPFLDNINYFFSRQITIEDIRICLYFLKTFPANKRNSLLVSLWFNNAFHNNCSYQKNESFNYELVFNFKKDSKNNRLIRFLLDCAFQYCISNDLIYYKDFESYIIRNTNNKNLYPDDYFPWISYLKFKNGKIKSINRSFGLGLVKSIIAFNEKPLTRKHPKIINRNRVQSYRTIGIADIQARNFKSNQLKQKVIKGLKVIKVSLTQQFETGINLNEKEKIIICKEYLTYSILDDGYYQIIE